MRRVPRCWSAIAAVAAALSLVPVRSTAQPAQSPEEHAEALYREADARVEESKPEEAIPLLEEAVRLKPTALGASYRLADCYERTHQPERALALFRRVAEEASTAGKAPLEADARARAERLLPRLLLDVPAPVRALPELIVTVDGRAVPSSDFGRPVPIDPGGHVITATAPGKKPMAPLTVTLSAGSTRDVSIQAFEDAPAPPPAAGAVRATPVWSAQRTAGIVVGGVGLSVVVVGIVFGARTLSKSSELKSSHDCTGGAPTVCNSSGFALYQEADKTATIADAALAIGAAGVIAGGVTLLTARAGKIGKPSILRVHAEPRVVTGVAGLRLRGEW
jgi:hypothetical protein